MRKQTEEEKALIQEKFENIFSSCQHCLGETNKELITKAFNLANSAHDGMWRKSGEPYIFHPIEVATIAAKEIGLGTKSIVSALLHDVVEDTDYTLEDIEELFGPKIAIIIDGLTKISGIFEDDSLQVENFKKMLLTLSDDVRVILIKLADRLHNMRTLGSMPEHKQLKIASETLYVYAPLAHRLGLYAIKTELEDLSLKYKHSKVYDEIVSKLKESEKNREQYITDFCSPIHGVLKENNINYTLTGRVKSVYSIWKKMQNKNVPFEEVFDIFAIRIIFDPTDDLPEKNQCWDIYSIITDSYLPNPDRLRDWVSTPKANGYEALHTTVMGPQGKWVEVQIRSDRMNEIAEKGYAAHWKYKDHSLKAEGEVDKWIRAISEMLQNSDVDALEFLDNFKMNVFASEIFVFTPKGELRRMPQNVTALDFAYEIHTEVGSKAIGAKVNHKLVPLSHILLSGDQVEIITSVSQSPKKEWLEFVKTSTAKTKINDAFKSKRKDSIKKGKQILEDKIKEYKLLGTSDLYRKLMLTYEVFSKDDLYRKIGNSTIDLKNFKEVINKKRKSKIVRYWNIQLTKTSNKLFKTSKKNSELIAREKEEDTNYELAECCSPIPGDNVMGIIKGVNKVVIHKKNCDKAIKIMASFGNRIVSVKWTKHKVQSFLVRVKINGTDRQGIVRDITHLLSTELKVNIRSLYFDSLNGVFEGNVDLYVHDTDDLSSLIKDIKKLKGVNSVSRVENKEI